MIEKILTPPGTIPNRNTQDQTEFGIAATDFAAWIERHVGEQNELTGEINETAGDCATAATTAQQAAVSAQAIAAAYGNELGLPSLLGKAGLVFTVNSTGTAAEWAPGDGPTQALSARVDAMRNAFVASVGFIPGWSVQIQNADGSVPPTDFDHPARIKSQKGGETVTATLTWDEDNLASISLLYVSTLPAASIDLGTFVCVYDAAGNFLSGSWS